MSVLKLGVSVLVVVLLGSLECSAQIPKEIICSTSIFENDCASLQRGSSSEVQCIYVQDAIECAQRIANGTADFGMFSAESILQLSIAEWPDLVVTKELRHNERADEPVDFESVVVVRATHEGGVAGLANKKFCHPGLFYDRTQRWSERFLKHFERTVVPNDCDLDGTNSIAAMEASSMARFFAETCRPGRWSPDDLEDATLKDMYPQLCSLCGTDGRCSYVHGAEDSGAKQHEYTLHCLTQRGDVAYVGKQETIKYFTSTAPERANEFAYMCPNGTLFSIVDNKNPCTWLRQPWGVIVSRREKSISHATTISTWASGGGDIWREAIRAILRHDNNVLHNVVNLQGVREYVRTYRNVPVNFDTCVPDFRWCTTSTDERRKCETIRAGGISAGILPSIVCNEPRDSVFECMNDIRGDVADFMGIDSNFGYLARNVYNLTAALYAETEDDKYASVAILVKNNASYQSLADLRGMRACMPEFGGIASIALVNELQANNLVDKRDCDIGRVLGGYFEDSCVPGSRDILHDPLGQVPQSLCHLCRTSVAPAVLDIPVEHADVLPGDLASDDNGTPLDVEKKAPVEFKFPELTEEEIFHRNLLNLKGSCAATSINRYYGNQGSLRCLDEVGDVAILESQFLNQHANELRLNPNNYRILCRNGTLANRPGFSVDENCLLTTTVDAEIVIRRVNGNATGITNVLLALDRFFLREPQFRMYNIYAGQKNLLFKDSTMGLEAADDAVKSPKIQNYVELFRTVELCRSGAVATAFANIAVTISLLLMTILVLQ